MKGWIEMAKLGNVVQMNTRTADKNVYGTIHTYLSRKGQNSLKTKETYERHIRDFFRTMRNKELEELVEEDLIFTKKQTESYQVALKNMHKGTTVNNAITAIKEVYKRLEDDGFDVNLSWFNLERYDEHDKQSWDTLSHEEVIEIIQLVTPTRKGKEKALLIRLAYATAFRRESLLTLKWTQFIIIEGVRYVKVLGKGNQWSHKKISDDLYQELMDFKVEQNNQDKVFQLTPLTVNRMMNFIRENMDFGDRRIVFHSFKKASVNEVNRLSGGDLKLTQLHADHKDGSTTYNHYLEKRKKEDLITVDINTHLPVEKLSLLSHDELTALVLSMDRNTLMKILQKGDMM